MKALRKATKHLPGWPVSGPRFEPKTFRTRSRISNHLVVTLSLKILCVKIDINVWSRYSVIKEAME
jgi:hypothetical protein